MPLAVVRTNLSKEQVPKFFLKNFSHHLVECLDYDPNITMAEILSDIPMIRDGSTAPMATVEFHHNDETITQYNKRTTASIIAEYIVKQLNINMERVLVMFFDARCTTAQCTRL